MKNKYKYVVTSGCSFTIKPPGGEPYGHHIAKHFNAEFINLSFGGASVPSMMRKTFDWCSKNKDKFKDTLFVFGLTHYRRVEMWSNKQNLWFSNADYFQRNDDEFESQYDETGYSNMMVVDWPKKQRKNYFINFFKDTAQFNVSTNIVIGIQHFLKFNEIDHIFFDALGSFSESHYRTDNEILFDNLVSQESWYIHPEFVHLKKMCDGNLDMRISSDDEHPNKKAHKYWAECLLEYIDEKN